MHSWIPCSAAKYKQWRNWVWISYVCTASRAHKTEWFLQSADRNNSGMFWKAPFFNADRGILIFLMFLSENVVNCSIYGKTSLFATLLFFLRSLFSGQKSKSCGQGFKNRPVTARVLLATCKVLPVTQVKIITFWPLMNFLQSPTFVKSGAYLKTIWKP